MRVALMLPNLILGGTERVSLTLANEFVAMGHEVEFVLLEGRGELLDEVRPEMKLRVLGVSRIRESFRALVTYFRHSPPDIAICNMWPLTVVAPLARKIAGAPTKVVVVEHCPLSSQYADWGAAHRFLLRTSIRLAFPLADARVGVSAAVADDLARLSGLARGEYKVIHNPIPTPAGEGAANEPDDSLWASPIGLRILTVGRLKPEKNHALLIRGFASLARRIDVQLAIVGDGVLIDELKALAQNEGCAERIHFPGFASDPFPWYRSANLFVLSSSYEGFGNVLVEAMACGTRVVSTDCYGGPREILDGGRYGTLVPPDDIEALAKAMECALSQPTDAALLKRRAEDFAPRKIAEQYLASVVPAGR